MITQTLIPFLEAAFERGLCLVPLGASSNALLVKKGLGQDAVKATSIEEAKEKWKWGTVVGYGVICGNGMIAIDVDMDVVGTRERFDKQNFPITFTVKSPNGFHLYYAVPKDKKYLSDTGSLFGKGIEVKGTGNRINGWGSVLKKGSYMITDPRPFTLAPDWLLEKIENRHQHSNSEPIVRGEPLYEEAKDWIINKAEPAIQNEGGDMATFNAAQGLIRHNLSREQITHLMKLYNEIKCKPMWSIDELELKIDNAIKYSERASSVPPPDKTPAPRILGMDTATPQNPEGMRQKVKLSSLADIENLPPPEYVLDGRLLRKETTYLVAKTNTGKTTIFTDWVLTLAAQGKRVLFMIGEDPSGFGLRSKAWRQYHKISEPFENAHTLYYDDFPSMKNPQTLLDLIATEEKFDVVVIDTLEKFATSLAHTSDSQDMAKVTEMLGEFAIKCDTAVLIAHHTPRQEERMKGSNSLDNTAGIILLMSKDKDTNMVKIRQEKNRSGGTHQKWVYKLETVPNVMTVEGLKEGVVAIEQNTDSFKSGEIKIDKGIEQRERGDFEITRRAILAIMIDPLNHEQQLNVSDLIQAIHIFTQPKRVHVDLLKKWIPEIANSRDADISQFVSGWYNNDRNKPYFEGDKNKAISLDVRLAIRKDIEARGQERDVE